MISFLLAPMGSACFGRAIAVRAGKGSTTACSALYRSLAINANGHIFAGADFVGGPEAFIVRLITEIAGSRVNQGVIETDVRALAINSRRSHFCRNIRSRHCRRVRDPPTMATSWTPVNNGLDCGNIWSLAINSKDPFLPEPQGVEKEFIVLLTTETIGTLTNTGLTSTDIAALAINGNNGHIFAGTHS